MKKHEEMRNNKSEQDEEKKKKNTKVREIMRRRKKKNVISCGMEFNLIFARGFPISGTNCAIFSTKSMRAHRGYLN